MGLGESCIRYWDEMKTTFLKKHQDYRRTKDSRNDIFKMQQQAEESLGDFVDRFIYVLQNIKPRTLRDEIARREILEEYIDVLNLMGSSDIYHFPFANIFNLSRKYSRRRAKSGKGIAIIFPG
jgi:hypothetical protein